MTKSPEVAFILAAGRGERLRPLTDKIPKPLLLYRGRPILDHILDSLAAIPLKRVVFNAWHLKEQVAKYVNERQGKYSFELKVSLEDELLGTAGGLKKALPLIGVPSFLMLNGDCLWKGDIAGFVNRAKDLKDSISTWWLTPPEREQTVIGVKDGRVTKIGQAWQGQAPEQTGCFTGIQYFQKIDRSKLPDKGCIVRQFWIPELEKNSKALGADFQGLESWTDIGTLERYQNL